MAQILQPFKRNMTGYRSKLEIKLSSNETKRVNTTVQHVLGNPKLCVSNMPENKQWDSSRSLRNTRNELHRHIMYKLCKASCNFHRFKQRATIRRLRQDCKSPSKFLNAGILTFRNIIRNQVPSTLKDVLAFVCLSSIMSEVLHSKGSITHPVDYFQSFPNWREAVQDQSERVAFDELVPIIWAEASVTLFNSPLQQDAANLINIEQQPWFNTADIDLFPKEPILQQPGAEEQAERGPISPSDMSGVFGYLADITDIGQIQAYQHSTDFDGGTSSSRLGAEHVLPSFQKPVKDLLEQTQAFEDIRWSDFLNLPDPDPDPGVGWNETMFIDTVTITGPMTNITDVPGNVETTKIILEPYDMLGRNEKPPKITNVQKSSNVADNQNLPGSCSLLAALYATVVSQVTNLTIGTPS
jgi:hypothetical protein